MIICVLKRILPKKKVIFIQLQEFPFLCKIGIYKTDNELDLRVNMDYAHDLEDGIYIPTTNCNICTKKFQSKPYLLVHIKSKHEQTLPACKYFQNDSSEFNGGSYWFPKKKRKHPPSSADIVI